MIDKNVETYAASLSPDLTLTEILERLDNAPDSAGRTPGKVRAGTVTVPRLDTRRELVRLIGEHTGLATLAEVLEDLNPDEEYDDEDDEDDDDEEDEYDDEDEEDEG